MCGTSHGGAPHEFGDTVGLARWVITWAAVAASAVATVRARTVRAAVLPDTRCVAPAAAVVRAAAVGALRRRLAAVAGVVQ